MPLVQRLLRVSRIEAHDARAAALKLLHDEKSQVRGARGPPGNAVPLSAGEGVVSCMHAHCITCGACFFPDRIVCALFPIEPRVFLSIRCSAGTYILIS